MCKRAAAVRAAWAWTAAQVPEEVEVFVDWLADQQVRSVLEIGTYNGGTAAMFLTLGCRVVSVDLPHSPQGGLTRRQCLERNRALARLGPFRGILGPSEHPAVVKQAAMYGPYDLVFIDGDHSPEGVARDWAHYHTCGRWVAFHDITPEAGHPYGTPAAWDALAGSKTIIAAPGAGWGGIGIVES